jgi:nicotinamidase-related amidase
MALCDPKTTALVVVDLQAQVLALPTAPYPPSQAVSKSMELAGWLRAQGGLLVYVRVGFAPDFIDAPRQPVDRQMPRPPGRRGNDGMDYPPELAAILPDVEIVKRNWGSFHGTELDLQLRRRGMQSIIVTGIATNMGVEQTVREGRQYGYACIVAEDACSSISTEMHEFAIRSLLPWIARVRKTAQILQNDQ